MRNMNRIYRSHTSRCNNKIMFAMHFCQVRLPDRRLCNYLQNVGATTYKNFLQFYAKSACKKHTHPSQTETIHTQAANISVFCEQ